MGSRLRQRGEQRLVQPFIAQPTVEAFRESVLLWLAGRDVVPTNLTIRKRRGDDGADLI
jgi:hypothetical protein